MGREEALHDALAMTVIFCLYTGRGLGQTNRTPGVSTQRGHEKASNERTKIMHPFLIVSYSLVSLKDVWTHPLLVH